MRSHVSVRLRISASFSAIHRILRAELMAQTGLPPIENVFSAPMLASHHASCGCVRGSSQLMNGYSHVPSSAMGTPSMPMPVTATALMCDGSPILPTASRRAWAVPPQICSGCHTVQSGWSGSGWNRSVGRAPLATALPSVS
ncbi:MAG: hypothetical protein AMS14_09730 [Planctomycetes bacterium DG_20]|nr:MAG: hypothetical protein AMS14_09730 [Planctomycetes bacterium DG_20]